MFMSAFTALLSSPSIDRFCNSKVDIVLEGGLPVLIEMMHSADVETAHQGTGVVANLAEVVENQGKMVESGEKMHKCEHANVIILEIIQHHVRYSSALRITVVLSLRMHTSVSEQCIRPFPCSWAIFSLVYTLPFSSARRYPLSGGLQHLKFVMRNKSVDVQREAVRGVANISAEYAYTAVIAGAGAIMPLVAMLSSPDFLCQR